MRQSGFYEYDPIIYPRRLFVVLGCKEIALSGFEGLGDNPFEQPAEYSAITFDSAIRKDTRNYGVLVYFRTKAEMTVEVMAHEASHVVDAIEEATGLEHGGETSAYLIGWIVKSLDEARRNIGNFIELKEDDR